MEPFISRQTFGKSEKLCHKKDIELLFECGIVINYSPIKALFLKCEKDLQNPIRVLFTVPKKLIRNATDRNRIKRLMREVYRRNKQELTIITNRKDESFMIAFIYYGKKLPEYSLISSVMMRIFKQIVQLTELRENSNTIQSRSKSEIS
jgi:ribonuclease P protein component